MSPQIWSRKYFPNNNITNVAQMKRMTAVFLYQFVFDGGITSWKPAWSLLLPLILLQKALTLITKWYCWVHSAFPNEFILESMVVASWSLWGPRLWLVSVIIIKNTYSNPAQSGWFLSVCSFSLCGPKHARKLGLHNNHFPYKEQLLDSSEKLVCSLVKRIQMFFW